MTIPANMVAGMINEGTAGNPVTLSIATPANGSTIANNTTAEAITGTAASTAGNITSIQYQIDGGAYTNFSFTPASSVNYSGGNAGEIGAGTHTINVKATDAVGNFLIVSTTYHITGASSPSYSWAPLDVYNGALSYLSILNATPLAAVTYTFQKYSLNGSPNGAAGGPVSLGTTDGSGNFSTSTTAAWGALQATDVVTLNVGGTNVASFTFSNFGTSPSYSYGPSVAPNGTTITLNIANSWGSEPVTQQTTFYPSGNVSPVTSLGTTSSTGNFAYNTTTSWGTDTSCNTTVYFNGVNIGTFSFSS